MTGYGMLPIPTEPGKWVLNNFSLSSNQFRHVCRVHCFLPEPSSTVQQLIAKLRRVNAEFVDPMLPANADGRYGKNQNFVI